MNKVIKEKKLWKFNQNYNKPIKRQIIMFKVIKVYKKEKDNLISYLKVILRAIKSFFRRLLLTGNEKIKTTTTKEIKEYYDKDDFIL